GVQNADTVARAPQMDSQHRSNGSNTRPALQAVPRATGRSRVAGRVERVVNTALDGERAAVLNATATELLAEPSAVAGILQAALTRPGVGVMGHRMLHDLFQRSGLHEELLNSLTSPNPVIRASAARICGAARLTGATIWIGDLVADPNPRVRDAAVRALAPIGDRAAADGLKRLALSDPDGQVKTAAERAHRRLVRRAVAR